MPDPTAIRLASEARRADLADELYSSVVEMHNLVDKAYQDERAAHLATLDLLAKAGADPGGDLDKLRDRYTTLDAENAALEAERDDLRAKLANLTGSADLTDASDGWRHIVSHQIGGVRVDLLTNGARGVSMDHREDLALMMAPSLGRLRDMDAMRAEVDRLATSRAAAESEAHRVAVAAAEVTAERDDLRRLADIAEASRADQAMMHARAQAALEEARARVAALEARPVLTEAMLADAIVDHTLWTPISATGRRIFSNRTAEALLARITAASPVTLPAPDRGEADVASLDAMTDKQVDEELREAGGDPDEIRARLRPRIDAMLARRAKLVKPPTPSPRYVAVRAEDVPPGTAPERVAWFGSITIASLTAKQLNSGGYKRSVMEWGGDPGDAAILDTHAEAPPVAPPRFIVVPRAEVNGRPASWFHTEAEAGRYVALCNDNPDLFGADDEIEGALESYTHAVVDTGATPPAALPQVEAFELPAVEWTEEVGGGAERSVGARHRAVACGDGSWRLTIDGKTTSSAESKARVEAAVALLTGRAEVRR